MENQDTQANIIKRILGRLPLDKQKENVAALKAVLGNSQEVNHRSFDFNVISSHGKDNFIATPYTCGETNENIHR